LAKARAEAMRRGALSQPRAMRVQPLLGVKI